MGVEQPNTADPKKGSGENKEEQEDKEKTENESKASSNRKSVTDSVKEESKHKDVKHQASKTSKATIPEKTTPKSSTSKKTLQEVLESKNKPLDEERSISRNSSWISEQKKVVNAYIDNYTKSRREIFDALMKEKGSTIENKALGQENNNVNVEEPTPQLDFKFPKRQESKDINNLVGSPFKYFKQEKKAQTDEPVKNYSYKLPEVSYYNCILSPFDQHIAEYKSAIRMRDRARKDFRFPSNIIEGKRIRGVSKPQPEVSYVDRAFFENTLSECIGYDKVDSYHQSLIKLHFPQPGIFHTRAGMKRENNKLSNKTLEDANSIEDPSMSKRNSNLTNA